MEISKEVIALWGAGLSTTLALIKIWELWSSRRRIEISYGFDGRPDVGNEIIIRNLSDKPMIVTYWELLFCKRKRLRWIPYCNQIWGQVLQPSIRIGRVCLWLDQ